MKIKIGNYVDWFGPYQLAEKLCFWVKEEKDEYGLPSRPDWVHEFGEWLAHGHIEKKGKIWRLSNNDRHVTWIYKLLQWIHSKKSRTVKIQIDKWDTWSMDHTLALIALPMLKQLQATKHGSPFIDDEDVPEELRSTSAPPKENDWDTDENHHARWDWVISEMIWAFEQLVDDDNESQFHSGESDIYFERCDDDTGNSEMKTGPKDTHVYDKEGHKKHNDRIQRGTTLFGKYYRGLWD